MIRDLFKSTMDKVMGRGGTPSAPRSVPYPFKFEARSAPKPAPPPEAVPMPSPAPAPAPAPVAEVAPEPEPQPAPVVEQVAEPAVEDAPQDDARPLEAWTVKELRAELIDRGHALRSRARKSELLDLMRAELEGEGSAEDDAVAADAADDADGAATDNAGGLDYDVVQELFDDMVRPALQADGGDISLIRVDGMDAHVRLVGACSTCPSSVMTMKLGVEALLKEEFPGFGSLIEV